jgi:acyl-CoA dehydrogenase
MNSLALDLDQDVVATAKRIATEVAAPAADAVDRDARFPRESIAALREARMLSAFVPRELGGRGATIAELAACCEALARSCASTAMIYAMHQIEVVCIVRHGLSSPFFRNYLAELADRERLIASATSEIGTSGDVRRSVCAVEPLGSQVTVVKRAPVISYGEEADAVLLTARRSPDAAPGDQVLMLVGKGDFRLTQTGGWDTLGMRGTHSAGFLLEATASPEQILPTPFADIARQTMIPTSHVLWTSCWLGVTSDAVARARAFVRAEARRSPGVVPPPAMRLAETVADLSALRATVQGGIRDFEQHQDDAETLQGMGFTIRMNNLKTHVSQQAPAIVTGALGICGVSGYRSDSPYSVGRHLRDTLSASLMISNDRIFSANAAMLLLHKED